MTLVNCQKREYNRKILQSDNKNKTVWQIVKEINGKVNHQLHLETDLELRTTADKYNKFLVESVEGLSRLQNLIYNCEIDSNSNSMYVEPVDSHEIFDIVKCLKNKRSSGEDEVSSIIIKKCIKYIEIPLVYIINNSLKYGVYPDQLKTAIIIPVYKKNGDLSSFNSFRPISLLSVFSKIFEMVMNRRIWNFLESNNIIKNTQHGYIKGKSTLTATYQFIQNIILDIDQDKVILGIFLDLTKAYDCLDHNILLSKLERYGISGPALLWIESYLNNRKQKVKLSRQNITTHSSELTTTMGVPQGSILGPTLFIIFMNDIDNCIKYEACRITKYADDTNLLITATDLESLNAEGTHSMRNIQNWLVGNRLILNEKKTTAMLFRTAKCRKQFPNTLNLCENTITISANTRFLGLELDSNLKWDYHINYLRGKLSNVCYSIKIIANYLDKKVLKVIYHSIFESRLRFGILFFGNSSDFEDIFVIQKRTLRYILGLNLGESCRGKFRELGILTAIGVFIQECLIYLFKNKQLFVGYEPKSGHTRVFNYIYPRHRLTLVEKGPQYTCIKLFNQLPNKLKEIDNLRQFKKKLYKLLVKVEPYSLEDFLGINLNSRI
nr:unnamed protein product [Callosobruchus analis]